MNNFKENNSIKLLQPNLDISKIKIDHTQDLLKNVNMINHDFEKQMKPVWERREKVEQAQIDTAKNTAKMNENVKVIIENQNKYIKTLEEQLKEINLTLDCVFNSVYDGKEILEESNEIYKNIYFEIRNGEKVNIKEMLIDKSFDVVIQVMFMLFSQGIGK